MKINEISMEVARFFGETQGRSISQILADCLGISMKIVHWSMIVVGAIIFWVTIYLIARKCKK